ncbi:hypothetical protein HYPSUDRAFT_171944 [Hypholoma sublateritium FD-334 SS-4]|uniref:Heterokaryon incompatibility domain-containing protein n=1 Tax=Hypholoma sublateritium (strain FD-334 SS-4) TaxID=945553 RepID=A0A0D2P6L9_HYPSF|nr:hypothetical protein HYPSUDRAFT_171944 [Hypholoma sublateritium FD-334 SS-4]
MERLAKKTAAVDIVSAIAARNDRVSGQDAVGQTLIAVLADFIVSTIQADTTAPGIGIDPSHIPGHPVAEEPTRSAYGAASPGSGLTTEGQDLLIAMKRFAASLVHSSDGQQTMRQSSGNLDQLQGVSSRCDPPIPDSGDLDVVGLDTSKDVQPLEGWDAHMWEFSGLGLIVTEADTKRQHLVERIIAKARDTVFNNMPIRLLMFDQDGKGITLVEKWQVMDYILSDLNSVTDLRLPYYHPFEKYAILSHTWLSRGEVTYSEWKDHTAPLDTQSPGYDKLAKFCEVAAQYGLRLAWMDTVCINKESSAELDESIRSMFKWYKGAEVCIAYLAETTSLYDMEKDRWFTRGWTLQELLAPHCIKFFSKSWTALSNSLAEESDKSHFPLVSKICAATGLNENELSRSPYLDSVPIWRKMQWAAAREVTREEDTAYSLMGIFNISMPTGYGEGAEHAFLRLVKEILSSKLTSVSKLEITNWCESASANRLASFNFSLHPNVSFSTLIPRSPRAYMHLSSTNTNIHFHPSSWPITLSYIGLCVPVLLMPSNLVEERLDNAFSPKGGYSATFDSGNASFRNYIYKVLDGDLFSGKNFRSPATVHTFAVLNIADEATEVLLPENGRCLAVKLIPHEPFDEWKIQEGVQFRRSGHHLTFDIVFHNNSSFRIPKDQLNRHGMTLRTMYL